MNLDVLIFAAHPDDAELSMGGTIVKFTRAGRKVGVIDLTLGEMSTRGNLESREAETNNATKIMKLALRENLKIPDGNIDISDTNLKKVVATIRTYKPQIIFAPYFNDRHPDHIDASLLVKRAMFKSGLTKFVTKINGKTQQAYRPEKLYYYMQTYTFEPTFIVDISESFKDKMEAIMAYQSQLYNSNSKEPSTFISSKNFIEFIEGRSKFYGFSIGKGYGEPFYCEEAIEYNFNDLLK
ncbi:MAG TPA: bacillithiol biosynthesis deacetylase BshB1 [Ignavibacteriaceae bacterium]|nr:bacillithiol biosynthesis deacetylase BshB1 [Ignavibacteriaceae bacterium]